MKLLIFVFYFLHCGVLAFLNRKPQNTLSEVGKPSVLTCCSSQRRIEWSFSEGGGLKKICEAEKCYASGYTIQKNDPECFNLIINSSSAATAGLYRCNVVNNTDHFAGAYMVVYNLTCSSNISSKNNIVEGKSIAYHCKSFWWGKLPFEIQGNIKDYDAFHQSSTYFDKKEFYTRDFVVNLKRPLLTVFTATLLFLADDITDENVAKNCPNVSWSSSTELVLYPVSNIRISCPEEDCVKSVGDLINCSADGFPTPVIQWLDWDKKEVGDGAVLKLKFSGHEKYNCIASNTIEGHVYTESKVILVKFKESSETRLSYAALIAIAVTFLIVMVVFCIFFAVFVIVRQNKQDKLLRDILYIVTYFVSDNRIVFMRSTSRTEGNRPQEGFSESQTESRENKSNQHVEDVGSPETETFLSKPVEVDDHED